MYYCFFSSIELRRVRFTMKAESVTKVSILKILVQVYYCCFSSIELQRVCFTMKAESVTEVNFFFHSLTMLNYCLC